MRTFGWDPSDEDLKDMVNVIDQVDTTLYLLHINLYLHQFVFLSICISINLNLYLKDMVNVIDQVDKMLSLLHVNLYLYLLISSVSKFLKLKLSFMKGKVCQSHE